jgi:hypothetical protein
MSGLYLNTGLCQGWNNPNNNFTTPTITYLSGTFSPVGGNTLVAIFGTNFKLYSIIKFGSFTPTTIFISSNQIDFYVPSTAAYGNYPVQVFNDTIGSNTVEYTLDSSPGFWYLNPSYSDVISNSNPGGLIVNGPIEINNVNTSSGTTIGNLVFDNTVVSGDQYIIWQNLASITANSSGVLMTGNLNVTGNITGNYVIPSDYRIKDIIEPLNNSYSVDNLKPCKYFNKISKKEEFGFIAHEVQQTFPSLVTGEKDGQDLQTLNYIGLIGILVQEIKELKAEVAELKKKN